MFCWVMEISWVQLGQLFGLPSIPVWVQLGQLFGPPSIPVWVQLGQLFGLPSTPVWVQLGQLFGLPSIPVWVQLGQLFGPPSIPVWVQLGELFGLPSTCLGTVGAAVWPLCLRCFYEVECCPECCVACRHPQDRANQHHLPDINMVNNHFLYLNLQYSSYREKYTLFGK